MRGAGDTSRDGRVSLDEAYRYAYHQTLLATAATAVGAQHVSLEVELEGQGEVPLTWPLAADAQLELPAPLEAEVLVERRLAGAVVAEVHKSRGAPVRIGLPAGDYRVLLNNGSARFTAARPDAILPASADGNGFDVEVADFDGDGQKDLFLCNRASLRNDPEGSGGVQRLLLRRVH